jgi:hypothetical protein
MAKHPSFRVDAKVLSSAVEMGIPLAIADRRKATKLGEAIRDVLASTTGCNFSGFHPKTGMVYTGSSATGSEFFTFRYMDSQGIRIAGTISRRAPLVDFLVEVAEAK